MENANFTFSPSDDETKGLILFINIFVRLGAGKIKVVLRDPNLISIVINCLPAGRQGE